MLYHNHCKRRRQYRFPISGRSFAYLKSETEMIKTRVLKSISFILLSWIRAKVTSLVKVSAALYLVQKLVQEL